MKRYDQLAVASITVHAPVEDVWKALINPKLIKQYMFGTDVISTWEVGSTIIWEGEFEGEEYEDKGEILAMEENRKLQYSYFSQNSGEEDAPENYSIVTVELTAHDGRTTVIVTQDNNANEESRMKAEENWNTILEVLKRLLEASD